MAEIFEPLRVAICGCGDIAKSYAASLRTKPDTVRIVGAYDVMPEKASALLAAGKEADARRYASIEEMLGDARVELVVVLTHAQIHAQMASRCLDAGKHVHTEKPLACTREDAVRVAELADARKLRLGCSPFTFMGEMQQTAWKMVRDGRLGRVRVIYAEMNWGRIEKWHPNPFFFYQPGAGPMFDVGVYPLTVLTTMFGPVARVVGCASTCLPDRAIEKGPEAGNPFKVGTPDFVVGGLHFVSGAVGRVTASFYVGPTRQEGIELHGDEATLHLSSAHDFCKPLWLRKFGEGEWQPVPPVREPYKGVEWGRAIFDMAEAIREGRPHRATGRQACHVADICCGILESAAKGAAVELTTRFDPPEPMPWAR